MAKVTRKTFLTTVDGTPKKRLFLSIISDYDLQTGLCELVDNAIDHWLSNGKQAGFRVEITLDADRQFIQVRDNAGGVAEEDAELLIAPGASGNPLDHGSIGIFGVGGKRAGVALGELVEIRTRRGDGTSIQIDLTREWVENPDWTLDIFQIPDIDPGTTTVDITKVRQRFDNDDADMLLDRLGEIYSWFINAGCEIYLNKTLVKPISIDAWAYPPDFSPKHVAFRIEPSPGKFLDVDITGGLITDRVPEGENYGVYFECNNRLVVKELKVREVGYYVPSEAGVPHPDASLARVVVRFTGPAELMPWNSSKSGITYSHPAFMTVRGRIIDFISYFSQVSRRTKHQRDEIIAQTSGTMEELDPAQASSGRKKILPRPPSTKLPSRFEQVMEDNSKIIRDQPWTLGLVEAMGLVDVIGDQRRFKTRNRAALMLLDSNFEIALKEFIVHRKDLFPAHKYTNSFLANLMTSRTNVIKDVASKVTLPQTLLTKVSHYYDLRNNLTHQRATVEVSDSDVEDYRKVIQRVLRTLFRLKFPTD
ncbi:ATP-binding protein [Caulobacter sp. CCG-8]|uniref:ATP-binding protein n=1 Tax=Caulobacter sp. CCG-8 TaxID=3127958 RepID=UPI00307D8C06